MKFVCLPSNCSKRLREDRTTRSALSNDKPIHVSGLGELNKQDYRIASFRLLKGVTPLAISDPSHVGQLCLREFITKEEENTRGDAEFERRYRNKPETLATVVEAGLLANFPDGPRQKPLAERHRFRAQKVKRMLGDETLKKYWRESVIARQLVTKVSHGGAEMNVVMEDGTILYVRGDLITFNCQHGPCMETHAHLTAATDSVIGRFNAYLYASCLDVLGLRDLNNYAKESLEFFACLDDELAVCGIDAFPVIKDSTGLVKSSWISQKEKNYMSAEGLQQSTLEKDYEGRPRKMKEGRLWKWLTAPISSGAEFKRRYEIAEMLKLGGYPTIDSIKSGQAIYVAAKRLLPIDGPTMADINNGVKRLLCKAYFMKNARWPLVFFNGRIPEHMLNMILRNKWSNHALTNDDFQELQFAQNASVDELPTTIELMEDRAIIANFEAWPTEYEWEAHRRMWGAPMRHMQMEPFKYKDNHKRVLMSYVMTPSVDLRGIVEDVGLFGLEANEKVMVLCPKERELSPTARLFCKLTMRARMAQVAQEFLIGSCIMPLIRQSSMAKSEAQLLMTLEHMAKKTPMDSDYVRLFLHFDFQKWNQSQVYESTRGVAEMMDSWFGTVNLFQQFVSFDDWHVFVQQRFLPPEQDALTRMPKEGLSYYHGSAIWCEGMAQKRWTLVTLSLINTVCEELGCTYILQGQGDNQTLTLFVPPDSDPRRGNKTKDQYLALVKYRIKERGEKIGLYVKAAETWWSEDIMEYGKKIYFKEIPVEGGLKAVSRSHALSGDDIESLANDVATAAAGGVSAAGRDRDPLPAYICSLFEVLETLDLSWKSDWWERQPDEQATVLLHGRILGGLPVCLYSDLLVRGTQDPLVQNLRQLAVAWDKFPSMRRFIAALVPTMRKVKDYSLILADVHALPIESPDLIEVDIQKLVRDQLAHKSKNAEILEGMKALNQTGVKQKLVEDLVFRMKPFYPSVASAVYTQTRLYQLEQFLQRFEKAATVRLLLDEDEKRFLIQRAREIGYEFKDYFLKRLNNAVEPTRTFDKLYGVDEEFPEVKCTTAIARVFRCQSWGFNVKGLDTPAPSEQGILMPAYEVKPEELSRAILIRYDGSLHPHSEKGRYMTYFGSATNIKARKGAVSITEKTRLVTCVKNLVEVMQWTHDTNDDNTIAFFEKLINEHTTVDKDLFVKGSEQVYGGSVQHRLTPQGTSRGSMINNIGTFASHVSFSTDGAHIMSKGGADWTVFFQLLFNHISAILYEYLEPGVLEYAFVLNCDGCVQEVEGDLIRMEAPHEYPGVLVSSKITSVTVVDDNQPFDNTLSDIHAISANIGINLSKRAECGDMSHGQDYGHVVPEGGGGMVDYAELQRCDLETVLRYLVFYSRVIRDICNHRSVAEIPHVQHLIPGIAPTLYRFCEGLIACQKVGELVSIVHEFPALHSTSTTSKGVMQLLLYVCSVIYTERPRSVHVPMGADPFTVLRIWKTNTYIHSHNSKELWAKYRARFNYAKSLMSLPINPRSLADVEYLLPPGHKPKTLESYFSLISRVRALRPVDRRNPIRDELPIPTKTSRVTCIAIPVRLQGARVRAEVPERPPTEEVRLGHAGRAIGRESSSASKVLEIFSHFQIKIHSGMAVCMAEGSGSIACMLGHLNSALRIMYNDLVADPPSSLPMYRPPCIATDGCLIPEVQTQRMMTGYRDLTQLGTVQKIRDVIMDENIPVSVVTMDAEVKGEFANYRSLLFNTSLVWTHAHPGALGVFKVFFVDKCVQEFIESLSYMSSEVHLVKPSCSDRSSSELYIICYRNSHPFHWPSDDLVDQGCQLAVDQFDEKRRVLLTKSIMDYAEDLRTTRSNQSQFLNGECLDLRKCALMKLGLDPERGGEIMERLRQVLSAKYASFNSLAYEHAGAHASLSLQNKILHGKRTTSGGVMLKDYCITHLVHRFAQLKFEQAVNLCAHLQKCDEPSGYIVIRNLTEEEKEIIKENSRKGLEVCDVSLFPTVYRPQFLNHIIHTGDSYKSITPDAWKLYCHIFGPLIKGIPSSEPDISLVPLEFMRYV